MEYTRSSHWNARWKKRERQTKTTQFDLSNSRNSKLKTTEKVTAIIIIFAARRNYGGENCAERTNRNKLLNV